MPQKVGSETAAWRPRMQGYSRIKRGFCAGGEAREQCVQNTNPSFVFVNGLFDIICYRRYLYARHCSSRGSLCPFRLNMYYLLLWMRPMYDYGISENKKVLQIIINCCKLKLNGGILHEKIIRFTVMFLYARFFYSMHKELNNFKN